MVNLHWHTEPLLLILVLGAGWLYACMVGPWRDRIAPGEPLPKAAIAWFYSGLAAGYLTVGSPLDSIGEQFLFSAHMLQHLLLVFLVPVLLLYGTPHWLVDTFLRLPGAAPAWRALTHPIVAGFSFVILMSIWHAPELYEAALHSKPVHVLEHATMFGTGLLVWWGFLSPSRLIPPRRNAVQMLYAFLLMVGQMPLFGFLVLSDEVLYPTYEFAPRLTPFPIDPMDDQILGGLMMLVANMAIYLALFGRAFFAWSRE